MDLLEEIIERVIEIIVSDLREEGDVYPPMASTASRRVLDSYDFVSPRVAAMIWDQAGQYEKEHQVFNDTRRFTRTSLPDVIAEFVKHEMGGEYQRLFDDRMVMLAPAAAAE